MGNRFRLWFRFSRGVGPKPEEGGGGLTAAQWLVTFTNGAGTCLDGETITVNGRTYTAKEANNGATFAAQNNPPDYFRAGGAILGWAGAFCEEDIGTGGPLREYVSGTLNELSVGTTANADASIPSAAILAATDSIIISATGDPISVVAGGTITAVPV